jgi:hypothetical protein
MPSSHRMKFTMITVSNNNTLQLANLKARRALLDGTSATKAMSHVSNNGTQDRLMRLKSRHTR